MLPNVYLAGPAREVERVISCVALLEERGFVLATPWWERVLEERKRGWKTDAEVPPEFMTENCLMNRHGLDRADFVIALTRSEGGMSAGTAGEVAYAVALHHASRIESLRKKIFIVGDPRGFVWSFDSSVLVYPTIDALLAVLPRRGY